LSRPLPSIYDDIKKNTISVFIAEFLLKTIKENEPDQMLFSFISESVVLLNDEETRVSDFHLFFLFRLTKYLGIEPLNNYSDENKIFDIKSGKFIAGYPNHNYYLNFQMSRLIHLILYNELKDLPELTNKNRSLLLEFITGYYNLHLDRPGELRSIKILKDVYS
jgi:DNA repair protein RecO (recombination protein O)